MIRIFASFHFNGVASIRFYSLLQSNRCFKAILKRLESTDCIKLRQVVYTMAL